jgi:hypothetical protein
MALFFLSILKHKRQEVEDEIFIKHTKKNEPHKKKNERVLDDWCKKTIMIFGLFIFISLPTFLLGLFGDLFHYFGLVIGIALLIYFGRNTSMWVLDNWLKKTIYILGLIWPLILCLLFVLTLLEYIIAGGSH